MSVVRPFSDVDLHAFVDDQVSPERSSAIAAYLRSTPSEAARVDSWRRQNEAIRSVFAGAAVEPVPAWLTIGQLAASRQLASSRERLDFGGVERSLGGRGGLASESRLACWRGVGRTLPWVTVLAALLAFAAGLLAPAVAPQLAARIERAFPGSPRAAAMSRFAVRTLEAHRTYGMDPERPAEVLFTGSGELDAWLQRHLGFPMRVPDLRSAGWTLKGGRIVPGDVGAAALLVYQDTLGDRLSMVVGQIGNPAPFDTSFTMDDGPTVVWMDGPLAFGLATSREGSWLADHAAALYRAVYQSRAE